MGGHEDEAPVLHANAEEISLSPTFSASRASSSVSSPSSIRLAVRIRFLSTFRILSIITYITPSSATHQRPGGAMREKGNLVIHFLV